MKFKSTHIILMLLGIVLQSCTSQSDHYVGLDPAGEARTKNRISDKQLTQLPRIIGVDELKALWGHAEGQPGPVFTYRCGDHDDQFFWVYYRREDETIKDSRWIIDHIVRADRIEESGIIVWPPNYTARPEPKIEYMPTGQEP